MPHARRSASLVSDPPQPGSDAYDLPVRLKPEDWNSGEIVWLLDVIAPSKPLAAAVLGNFGRLAGKAVVFIHPVAARQVEKEVLEKLQVAR